VTTSEQLDRIYGERCASSLPKIRTNLFDPDPTLQDTDDDMDWMIRDRESEHLVDDVKSSIENGAMVSLNGNPVDSHPPRGLSGTHWSHPERPLREQRRD
jgi:hypothetical protein